MATPVIMPRQGQSVESCIITKWHKQKGDQVAVGDILFSYETDKASFEEESKVSGVMLDIFFEEGDDVPCLTNVCVIGNPGESTAEFNPDKSNNAPEETVSGEIPNTQVEIPGKAYPDGNVPVIQSFTEATATGAMVKISPRARALAEKSGIDYRYATPSGPYGRIIEQDIIALKKAGVAFTAPAMAENYKGVAGNIPAGTGLGGRITTSDLKPSKFEAIQPGVPNVSGTTSDESLYEEVKITNIRKVIAKTMHFSLSSTAQLTLNTSFDASDILEFRKKLKSNQERLGLENITINDIIIYAVSRTLLNHRALNAHFLDDRMLYFKNVNLGVAVDTERGLMVPTIFNANQKSLNQISKEVKQLVKDCQTGTINPDLLKGGSFTITNLGTLDIESFTPILNPPQTGILGVNAIVQRVKEVDGDYQFYPSMGLSLTFDHRAIDGAPAARFLKELKNNLENFSVMLAR